MGKILVIGSVNVDYSVGTDRWPKPGETVDGHGFTVSCGGKGANQAIAMGRLGASVSLIGATGDDSGGTLSRENLAASSVGTEMLLRVKGATGSAVITVCRGENEIIVDPGANRCVTPDVILSYKKEIAEASMIVMQQEIPMASVVTAAKLAREFSTKVILNPAPVKEADPALYPLVDWLIPNETEAEAITGIPTDTDDGAEAALRRLCEMGCRNVILTLGRRGCLYSFDGHTGKMGIFPVETVDTTAAGDSFIGGFCTMLSEGRSPEEAIRFATAVSALTVSRRGASVSIPSRKETEAFLASVC